MEGAAEVLAPEVGSEQIALFIQLCDEVPVVIDVVSLAFLLPGGFYVPILAVSPVDDTVACSSWAAKSASDLVLHRFA